MTEGAERVDAAEAGARVLEAVAAGHRVVVVLRPDAGPGAVARRRIFVEADSGVRAEGSLGAPELDARADAAARAVFAGDLDEGLHDGLYVEVHAPVPELIIVGAGHIARPLCAAAALLDFQVTVLDDRPSFATRERFPDAATVRAVDFSDPFAEVPLGPHTHVVLVTRGHRYDYECLRRIVTGGVELPYVGMIGSRRRVRATFEALIREGVAPARLTHIRAPVGLDLGAQTPAEIAVSVAAELVLARRGGSGQPLCQVERVVERFLTPGAVPASDPQGEGGP